MSGIGSVVIVPQDAEVPLVVKYLPPLPVCEGRASTTPQEVPDVPSVVRYLPPLPVIEGTYDAAVVALEAAAVAELAAEVAEVAAEDCDVNALDAEVAAELAEVAAEEAEVAALDTDAFTLASNDDNETHVPVLVSVSVIRPISRTRPEAT